MRSNVECCSGGLLDEISHATVAFDRVDWQHHQRSIEAYLCRSKELEE